MYLIIEMYAIYLFWRGLGNTGEEYLEVISDLLAYDEFVKDYNIVYDIAEDIERCKMANKEM